ncbi:class III extradiol dioxygenase subunit B-like domain-containing protein [Sphaerisporangium perillae]|uniref:class III extradiol dioxygenase subunit B-like domain-containing protein n=1 Tax=Sphaerisporangium perillae TaxID=2935860 RepID=UPI00200E650F|nr:class III extradiol dioxygenase subunit B-like domain-containing protein [Sphaerisporangium perillae]
MLVAAAVCPHPPLIVPELAGAASPELDGLREACVTAIRSLAGSRPDVLVVIGAADAAQVPAAPDATAPEATASEATASEPKGSRAAVWYGPDAGGSLAPWGADVRVGAGRPVLPLSLTVGRWLADLAGAGPVSGYEAVPPDASSLICARLGAALAVRGRRVALLVMGDGSAKLTTNSPGYHDPRAQAYDEELARALGGADAPALAALDPAEAAELWVAGRAAFQVLAGAAAAEDRFHGELLYDDAPYGVGYLVARWSLG